jgi:hypothetical protein
VQIRACQRVLNQTAKNKVESTHLDKEIDATAYKATLSFSFCCQEMESNDNSNNTSQGERELLFDRKQFGGDVQFVLQRGSR